MNILSYAFTIFTVCGIWRPMKFSSGWKKYLYWIYTSLIIVLLFTFMVSHALYLLQDAIDVEGLASSSFTLLTFFYVSCKATNILRKRDDINFFLEILNNKCCRPQSIKDKWILQEADTDINRWALGYTGMVLTCVISVIAGSIFNNIPNRTLPIDAWIPFDYSTQIGFWCTYLYQISAYSINSAIGSMGDVLVCGLISQVCAQLKLLKFRLLMMPSTILEETTKFIDERCDQAVERRLLNEMIRHHNNIFKFAELVNDVFNTVILIQCITSTFILCVTIFIISKSNLTSISEFAYIAAYSACMVFELFLYCWFGNEVIYESMDVANAIYLMDWTELSVQTQKNLLILMGRAQKPIKFTSGNIILLSCDTYVSILKLSYSIYNLLKHSSEQ